MKTLAELGLTELEQKFVETLITELYAEPDFTDVGVKEISKKMNCTVDSAKGVLGSLVKKGIVDVFENYSGFDLVILNTKFYYLHPVWSNQ